MDAGENACRGSSVTGGLRFSCFFFSSRRRHTRCSRDWSSDVCSSDLLVIGTHAARILEDDGGADVHDAAQSPATTEISTRNLGWASRASTVARAGVLPESTQASHTSFISLYDAMFAR